MTNWKTSFTGIVGGIALYIVGIGAKLPSTRGEWAVFISGAVLAALGISAKDANPTQPLH